MGVGKGLGMGVGEGKGSRRVSRGWVAGAGPRSVGAAGATINITTTDLGGASAPPGFTQTRNEHGED